MGASSVQQIGKRKKQRQRQDHKQQMCAWRVTPACAGELSSGTVSGSYACSGSTRCDVMPRRRQGGEAPSTFTFIAPSHKCAFFGDPPIRRRLLRSVNFYLANHAATHFLLLNSYLSIYKGAPPPLSFSHSLVLYLVLPCEPASLWSGAELQSWAQPHLPPPLPDQNRQ